MKHISGITKQSPFAANAVQDILCDVNEAMNLLLGLKGGTSPFKEFVTEKCAPDVPSE